MAGQPAATVSGQAVPTEGGGLKCWEWNQVMPTEPKQVPVGLRSAPRLRACAAVCAGAVFPAELSAERETKHRARGGGVPSPVEVTPRWGAGSGGLSTCIGRNRAPGRGLAGLVGLQWVRKGENKIKGVPGPDPVDRGGRCRDLGFYPEQDRLLGGPPGSTAPRPQPSRPSFPVRLCSYSAVMLRAIQGIGRIHRSVLILAE